MGTHDVQRKHFRFPAFSDDEGVKISEEHQERVIFAGDDFLTRHTHDSISNQYESEYIEQFDGQDDYQNEVEEPNSYKAPSMDDELKRYDEVRNKPDFSRPLAAIEQANGVTIRRHPILRSKEVNHGPATRKNPRSAIDNENLTLRQQYSGGMNRFRSKSEDIPAQKIVQVPKPRFTKDELLTSMIKPQDSYLLLDNLDKFENVTAEKKKEGWQAPAPRISATQKKPIVTQSNRSQTRKPTGTKQTSPTKKQSDLKIGTPAIKVTDKRKVTETAIGKKKTALDRGLGGLIEEQNQNNPKANNQLFS
jgi:hypothetical protein